MESGYDIRTVQELGQHSILTTARYTHPTSQTNGNAEQAINALMSAFSIDWRGVK